MRQKIAQRQAFPKCANENDLRPKVKVTGSTEKSELHKDRETGQERLEVGGMGVWEGGRERRGGRGKRGEGGWEGGERKRENTDPGEAG